MKIAIEAQRIFRKNKHGMDYVVLQEILHLQRVDRSNEYYVFVRPGEDRCLESTDNVHVVELRCPTYPLWEQWALPRAVRRCGAELLHCTSNTAPIHAGVPLLLTLHDVIFMEPQSGANSSRYQRLGRDYRRFVLPRVLPNCLKIITVSDTEKENIVRTLHIDRERVATVYNGYSEWFRPMDKAEAARVAGGSGYLLHLGNTDPKKNTERTVIAYGKYLERTKVGRELYIADIGEDCLDGILARNGLTKIRGKIRLLGYVANDRLPYYYNAAFAFLYTSLRESFGIPLLEAMACGTAVVCSGASCLPEIAGKGSVMFVEPTDADDIANGVMRLEEDGGLRETLTMQGMRRVADFSWQQTAEQLLAVYREAAMKMHD